MWHSVDGERPRAQEAGSAPNGSALLARFVPAPGRAGRVVLHPRLTVVPVPRSSIEPLAETFCTDGTVRILRASEVVGAVAAGERVAVYDDEVRSLTDALETRALAAARLESAEHDLAAARAVRDRVAVQRARADEAMSAATERLAELESPGNPEVDLRRDVEAARTAATRAAEELAAARAAVEATAPDRELEEARADLAGAERALRAVEAKGRRGSSDIALDAASHQLEVWAAQRAVETARHDVERLERVAAAPGAHLRLAAAEDAFAHAQDRVADAENALAERSRRGALVDPDAEARALREQIDTVSRALDAADRRSRGDEEAAEETLDAARRALAAADRVLAATTARLEPGDAPADPARLLTRLRSRREAHAAGGTGCEAALRRLVAEADEDVVVLVDGFDPTPSDLIAALGVVSASKQIVFVTADGALTDAAHALDPEVGAVRVPLDTPGMSEPVLARTDGNQP